MSERSRDRDVARRVFDSLFHGHAGLLRDELREELLAVGYDATNHREGWPVTVWRGVLDVVRRKSLPLLSEKQGFRELGRRFARGFGQTPVGWVFGAVAPMLGPERALLSVPKYLHVVRQNMSVELHQMAAQRWRLVAMDEAFPQGEPPDFLAGCLEGVLLSTKVTPTIMVVTFEGPRLELELSW